MKEATMGADNDKSFVPMMARNEAVQDARIPLPDPDREPEVYTAAAKLPRNLYDWLASKGVPIGVGVLLVLTMIAHLLHLQVLATVFACTAMLSLAAAVGFAQAGVERRATEVARQRLNGGSHD